MSDTPTLSPILPDMTRFHYDAEYHALVYMIFAAVARAMHNWNRKVQRVSDTPTIREELDLLLRHRQGEGHAAKVERVCAWLGVDPDTPADQWRKRRSVDITSAWESGVHDATQEERDRCLAIIDGLAVSTNESSYLPVPEFNEARRRIKEGTE